MYNLGLYIRLARTQTRKFLCLVTNMQVFEAWLVYLIIVAIVWIVLSGSDAFNGLSHAVRLFLALLAGAIVVFLLTSSIVTTCVDDRFWFCILIFFAYLAPIIIGLWLLFTGGWESMRGFALNDNGEPKIERTYACAEEGCFPVTTKIKTREGKTTIHHY